MVTGAILHTNFQKMSTKTNPDFTKALEDAVLDLQNDYASGARQLGDKGLSYLSTLVSLKSAEGASKNEFWSSIKQAVEALSAARPSMRCVTA